MYSKKVNILLTYIVIFALSTKYQEFPGQINGY